MAGGAAPPPLLPTTRRVAKTSNRPVRPRVQSPGTYTPPRGVATPGQQQLPAAMPYQYYLPGSSGYYGGFPNQQATSSPALSRACFPSKHASSVGRKNASALPPADREGWRTDFANALASLRKEPQLMDALAAEAKNSSQGLTARDLELVMAIESQFKLGTGINASGYAGLFQIGKAALADLLQQQLGTKPTAVEVNALYARIDKPSEWRTNVKSAGSIWTFAQSGSKARDWRLPP